MPALGCLAALARAASRADVVQHGYPYAARCPDAGVAERVGSWNMRSGVSAASAVFVYVPKRDHRRTTSSRTPFDALPFRAPPTR
jgi:hypothetical protein